MVPDGKLSPCPRCGTPSQDFLQLDAGMRLALQSSGNNIGAEIVCHKCYEELSRSVSKGVQLRAEQKAREQNRVMLWKSRVNLIKQARQLMEQKAFSEAAVAYEKYLRVLEIVYDLKSGELKPEVFNNSSRSKEVTVIASVYWDLMRIYDTSTRYGDRMDKAAKKLAIFLPYSTAYADIIKKAEAFQRMAKNPNIVKNFLKAGRKGRARCFIATAAFENPYSPEVQALRIFRDQVLKQSPWGRRFVLFYYRFSPPLAEWLDRHSWAKKPVRGVLRVFAERLGKMGLKRPVSS